MSSVLFVNPFAQPSQPPQQSAGPDNSGAQSDDAVTPVQNSGNTGASGNATSDSGSGSGQNNNASGQGQQPPPARSISALLAERPSNATSGSVVRAQTSEITEQSARAQAINSQRDARNLALIDSITAPKDPPRVGDLSRVMERKMPDPLPTSPFLKDISDAG